MLLYEGIRRIKTNVGAVRRERLLCDGWFEGQFTSQAV